MNTITNVNKIIMLLFLIFLIGLTSCRDTSQQNKSTEKPQFKTKEEAISSIYNSFLYEKTVCQKFLAVIAEDKEFIKNFEYLGSFEYRDSSERQREYGQRLSQRLSKSKAAKNEVVQYIQKHTDYFIVDQDFHGGAGMTYVKDSPIFCMQTDRRLEEIENFGPSEQSWKVREYYLNLDLDNLLEIGMPWSEGGGVWYDFNTLRAKVDTAKKLYSQQYKEPLKNWVQKASIRLEQELRPKGYNTSYYSTLKEKDIREVEGWITELNKGLE